MTLTRVFMAALVATLPLTASAQMMMVEDAYARTARPDAPTGAAYLMLHNMTGQDDRLLGVSSDIAARVELHTHIEGDGGLMQMVHVEEGFDLPADGRVVMQRGGAHIMFMGLTRNLENGDDIDVTLTFETAPPLTVTIPVDLDRMPGEGSDHSGHGSDG